MVAEKYDMWFSQIYLETTIRISLNVMVHYPFTGYILLYMVFPVSNHLLKITIYHEFIYMHLLYKASRFILVNLFQTLNFIDVNVIVLTLNS